MSSSESEKQPTGKDNDIVQMLFFMANRKYAWHISRLIANGVTDLLAMLRLLLLSLQN